MPWQEIIVGVIVVAAIAFLAIRAWRVIRRAPGAASGCGTGCSQCPKTPLANEKPLVQIDLSRPEERFMH